jgi:hypothetical protein
MSKHLMFGSDVTTGSWRLPAETDIAQLTNRLQTAMETGTVERVAVELNDNPLTRGDLLFNGAVIASAVVVELPEL